MTSLSEAYGTNNTYTPVYLGYNNKYPSFPPFMQDGREIASSWQPEAEINRAIIRLSGITSNWEYRRFLTANGKQISETNFDEAVRLTNQ